MIVSTSLGALAAGEQVQLSVGDTLRVANLGGSDIRLEWQPAQGAAGYNVWRSPHPDGHDPETAGWSEITSFDETSLPQSATVYFYQVRAENGCREEGP